MKSHLVIFEEKLDMSELTDREKLAYEAGKREGQSWPGAKVGFLIIFMSSLCLILGAAFYEIIYQLLNGKMPHHP